MRNPFEVAADIAANDLDHLAHNGDPDVGVAASANLDQLLGPAANVLVEAEEVELRVVVVNFLDLEDSTGVCRIATECRRAIESEIRRNDAVTTLDVELLGRLVRGRRRWRRCFAARTASRLDVARKVRRW